eukprot:3099629-Lingulodinium_polyedra.AAC.1
MVSPRELAGILQKKAACRLWRSRLSSSCGCRRSLGAVAMSRRAPAPALRGRVCIASVVAKGGAPGG